MKKNLATVTQEAAQYLSNLPPDDRRARDIRDSLHALLQALTIRPPSDVPEHPHVTPPPPPGSKDREERDRAVSDAVNGVMPMLTRWGGSRAGYTERRIHRLSAGFSLHQAAEMSGTSTATVMKYEARRSSVREDKRRQLDKLYEQFRDRAKTRQRNVQEES
jgi:hypothetical protein